MKMSKQNTQKFSLATTARRRIQERYPEGEPGKASDYICYFDDLIQDHKNVVLLVVLFGRVSASAQNYRGNLGEQIRSMKEYLRRYDNICIIAEIKDVASGWKEERDGLREAVNIAIENDAMVLTESTDRYIRSPYYHSQYNPLAKPTDAEYKNLIQSFHGVKLTTMLHPDANWKEVRSHQTKRGQYTKKSKGGRPTENKPGYKKQRQLDGLIHVLRLRKEGCSWGDIVKATGIPKTTAWDWVRKYRK